MLFRSVGRISELRVLTSSEAEAAAKEYRARGWFKEMTEQVERIHGKLTSLEAPPQVHHLLNVRYRPESLEFFVPFRPADEYLEKLPNRYRVYQPRALRATAIGQRAKRLGINQFTKASLVPQFRRGSGTTTANPIEKIMQQEICDHLRKQHLNFEAERDFVDIKVEEPEGITLIEIKSSPNARLAIRAALGQILEYAFVHPEWRSSLFKLVIVGQGLPTEDSKKYIEWLCQDYNLPVRYISYRRGSTAFRL